MYNIVTKPTLAVNTVQIITKHIFPNSVQARPKHMFLTVYKPFLVPPVPVDDVGLADHLVEPVLDGGVLAPPLLGTLVSDAVHRYLMTMYIDHNYGENSFFTQLQRLKETSSIE